MRASDFRELLASLSRLTARQREALLGALEQEEDADGVRALLKEYWADGLACPHCGSERVIGWGQASGLPRWRCKGCGRTFNPLTGTALAGLRHRERWAAYAASLRRGEVLREAAERCGIHINTAHRWRHRFLRETAESRARLVGIAEADETLLLRSAKGQPALRERWGRPARRRGGKAKKRGRSREHVAVFVARDRSGTTVDGVLERVDAASLEALLKPTLDPDTVLCTDGLPAYGAVAARLGLKHEALTLRRGERVAGPFHIQNVNNYHSRWKGWLRRFHGVSTRYLPSYLAWFRTLDAHPDSPSATFMLRAAFAA